MLSKEEIEEAYWQGYTERDKKAQQICKECKYRKKLKQLETREQKLIEKLEEDKMKEFDDYTICLIESYLKILKGEKE